MTSSKALAGALAVALIATPPPRAAAMDGGTPARFQAHPHGVRPVDGPGMRPRHGVRPPGYRPGAPGYRGAWRPPPMPPGYSRPPPPPGGWGWGRPSGYWWGAGGAIAAGAAIGFVGAAAAAAWAPPPPAPGLCWYYTDPGRTQGFWDNCP